MYEGWETVGFRQSNRRSDHVLQGTKVGTRLISQIQLSIQPLPLMYEGWKAVGFRQPNRHSNHVL